MQRTKTPLPTLPGWLSVKQAAEMAGRSTNSIRRAIALGHLPARHLNGRILIATAHWQAFVLSPQPSQPAGTREPRLDQPTEEPQARMLTTLTVPLRPGQQEALAQCLRVFAQEGRHTFPGTLDRSIRRCKNRPDMVLILLIWDAATLPPEEEREAMLAALRSDLAMILDWNMQERFEQRLSLHTL